MQWSCLDEKPLMGQWWLKFPISELYARLCHRFLHFEGADVSIRAQGILKRLSDQWNVWTIMDQCIGVPDFAQTFFWMNLLPCFSKSILQSLSAHLFWFGWCFADGRKSWELTGHQHFQHVFARSSYFPLKGVCCNKKTHTPWFDWSLAFEPRELWRTFAWSQEVPRCHRRSVIKSGCIRSHWNQTQHDASQ